MTVNLVIETIIVICSIWAIYATLCPKNNMNWEMFFREMLLGIVPTKDHSRYQLENTLPKDPIYSKFSHAISWDDIGCTLEPNLGFTIEIQAKLQKKLQHNILVGEGIVSQNIAKFFSQTITDFQLVLQDKTDEIAKHIVAANKRFVWIVTEKQWQPLVEFLHRYPGVRDYTRAVVAIDPVLDEAWWQKKFTQDQMDVEANIAIPYFFFVPVSTQLIEPMASPTGWKSIQLIPFRDDDVLRDDVNCVLLSKIIVLTLAKYQEVV